MTDSVEMGPCAEQSNSFRDEDGRFPDPIYTIPDLEDEEVKDEEAPPPNYQPLKGETVKGEKE
jgi:hypothetical protein